MPTVVTTAAAVTGAAVDQNWQRDARCRAQVSSYFFPPSHGESKQERTAREAVARTFCSTCPVQRPCLDLAVELDEPHGIWAGMNARERRSLGRQP